MKILLDTNAYSAWKRGDRTVIELVRRSEWLHFSPIVVGELLFGFREGSKYQANVAELEDLLGRFRVSLDPITWITADRFARIASALRRKGRPIPSNDIWIAAQALELGADLISYDQHFSEVDALPWVDPTMPRV